MRSRPRGGPSLLWQFVAALLVVGSGAGLIYHGRTNSPRSPADFANLVFLVLIWVCLFGLVLYTQLRERR